MKSMTYKRKNNDNTFIDINSDTQPEMNSSYSFGDYAKVGLAIVGTVAGATVLANKAGFVPSSSRGSNAAHDNLLDHPYQLINPQEPLTFAANNFPVQPRHAKRAGFGSEFQVNTYTTDMQLYPSIAGLSTGDFVVVWRSWSGQNGDPSHGYGQRFSNTGIHQGGDFQINTHAGKVAALSTGDFVVVWMSNGQDGDSWGIYGQRFSSVGVSQGSEFQINTYTTDMQTSPSIAALGTGDFVVAWTSYAQDGDSHGIYGQRFSSAGVAQGSEFQINTYATSSQGQPSLATLTTGDFVVTWDSDGQDGDQDGIYGQRYSSTGVPQGSEFQINTYITGSQSSPSIVGLTTGDFVVVWTSDGQDGDKHGIYGQRFSNIGIPQGNEFQVNTYTTSNQWYPSVAALSTGDFVVTWQSAWQDGGSILGRLINYGVYGQRYLSTGVPQGSEFQINTYITNSQNSPSIVGLTTGDFVVVWVSHGQDGDRHGIYGRIYFNNDMPPELTNNALTINEGATVILSTLNLNTHDPDSALSDLTFTVSNLQQGQFERVSNAGIAITSFTQQDIIDGAIQFVHDGSKNQPSYNVTVSDGSFIDGPVSANITFVYIAKNQLVIQPGEFLILGPQQLDIQAPLAPTDLEIRVTDVQFGHFEKNDGSWKVTDVFNLFELNVGNIRFVHDGTENKPHYILQFRDLSTNYTFTRQIIGNTILNHPPELTNPIGVISKKINEAFSYTLPNNVFIDPDAQMLQIIVTPLNSTVSPAWIQFDNLTTTLNGKPIQVGSFGFKAIATDPYGATAEDRFYIDVKSTNGTNIFNEGTNPVPIVAAIAGGAALLACAVAGGIVYFKKAQDRKTRQQHKFAQLIRHHLKLKDVDNFKSEEGQRFVQAVQSLSNLLYNEQGINVADMDKNHLDALAQNIAAAAKNKISPTTVGFWKKSNISIQEFADNIENIARDNCLFGLNRNGDDVNIPMHTMYENEANNNLGTVVEGGVDAVRQFFSPKAEFV